MTKRTKGQVIGITAAVSSALFLGLAPVFGKLAMRYGLPPLAVVGLRTLFATVLLFVTILIYKRPFLYIYPAGLLGCALAGGINGFGSLLYYLALGRIEAGLGQMVYSLYPLFVALLLWLDHEPPSRMTVIRLLLVIPALLLLTGASARTIDWVGVWMMLGASMMYALHLPINQRVLLDMPAPTVTLYTLMFMSLITLPAAILIPYKQTLPSIAWGALLGLTLVTFASRLTLFMGVKHLGGLQTALLGLGELLVTVGAAHLFLGERLSLLQWLGAILLFISLALVAIDKTPKSKPSSLGWLSWLRPQAVTEDFPWHPHN